MVKLVTIALMLFGIVRYADEVRGEVSYNVSQEVLNTMTWLKGKYEDRSLSSVDRDGLLKEFLREKVDVVRVSNFALGRDKRRFSEEQLVRYRDAFLGSFVKLMSSTLDMQTREGVNEITYKIVEIRKYATKKTSLVRTEIYINGSKYEIIWRMFQEEDGSWRYMDIIVEGISALIYLREKVKDIMLSSDNEIDLFINNLKYY